LKTRLRVRRLIKKALSPFSRLFPAFSPGYSEQSPWYKIQKWVDGKWSSHRLGWCGTGVRRCTIPPGRSSVTRVHVKEELFPIRIGVKYSKGNKKEEQVIWSASIDKKASNKASGSGGK